VKNAGTEDSTVIRVTPPPNRVAAEKFPADPEWDGHVFEGWYAAGGEFTADTPVTGDMTVYARWTGGGTAPSDDCDIILYYFEDPACVGVPDAGDPLKITITYPAGTGIPADENKIKVLHNGKDIRKGGWSSGAREYTVIAESGKEKTYVVTAVMGEEPPVPAEEACEILLYYFKKPDTTPPELLGNGKLVLENRSGSDVDPFFIDITYPYGTEIPADGDIVYLFKGADITWGGWSTEGDLLVRDYTVTAENEAKKYYRVMAAQDAVAGVKVTGITLNRTSLTLESGTSETLIAAVFPDNPATNKQVTWLSGNTGAATVDQTGTVTAAGPGTATIIATTKDGPPYYTAACFVTVGIPVTGVSIAPNPLTLAVGETKLLSAVLTPPDPTIKTVTLTSSDTGIAAMVINGWVKGVKEGTATITVSADDGGYTADCEVTVTAAPQAPPAVVLDGIYDQATWEAAIQTVNDAPDGTGGSPAVFEFKITGSFGVPGIIYPEYTITGAYKEVWLTGDETKTISLNSNGSLICTAANQTFVIDGVTLQGRANNDSVLVGINPNSAVELRSGTITGNTSSGGVYVWGGNFTMSGGTISENTAIGGGGFGGGGVFVYGSGTFTMSGGTVSGNTATSNNGGGVYVGNGTFTMSGGTVSENTAVLGGGVYVASSGTFTMSGGTISENTASSGGGVVVGGENTFTMKGGTISGNKATGGNGGGVYASGSVTFTMSSNAAITGNTASANGGGVYVNGTFTMTSGTVSGNAAVLGGGVYIYNGTFTKVGGGIIYGDSPEDTDHELGSNENTATDTFNIGKNGHAVFLQKTSPTAYYYRNEDLNGADNISTTAALLPTSSGETANKWTKR
jgi:uncharacterized repeat protein (TIGR02543 family)